MARNFIDRCFEAVAPVHAVRRSAARTALQFLNSGYGNYGANLTKKSMRGWEYCHPYSAFERGSNENANSLIRRWLPKGTKLSEVSQAEIKQIQIWMNNYPRMVLGGRCANTALAEWMAAEGVLLPLVHI